MEHAAEGRPAGNVDRETLHARMFFEAWGVRNRCAGMELWRHPALAETAILVMRYTGLRISDVATLRRDRIKDGKLFLYAHKANVPVWIPLPKSVVEALDACDKGGEFYF